MPDVRSGVPTNSNDVELETTLQELVLDLRGDRVETDIGCRANLLDSGGGHFKMLA